MAEGPRFKEIQEQQKRLEMLLVEEHLEELQAKHGTLQQTLEGMQKSLQQQMQSILDHMHHYNKSKSLLGDGLIAQGDRAFNLFPDLRDATSIRGSQSQENSSSFPSVEFLYFNGSDPRAWVQKSNMYFNVISIFPEDQRVPSAVVHFLGKAERWFQNYLEERQMPSGDDLIVVFMEMFDDVEPALHLELFDDSKSHVLLFNKELRESFFISCFISGLKEEIKGSILVAKPQSFQQAVALVKQFESIVDALISRLSTLNKLHNSNPPSFKTPAQPQRSFSSPPKPPYIPKPNTTPHVRKLLTTAEMKARRGKNLCYNCDKTNVPGHRCKQRHLFLMMIEDEEEAYMNDVGCEKECVKRCICKLSQRKGNYS
ncbi:hypothetical protein CDL12_01572 [Handroanthus impetiginosus]|uniref:Retrotransposon gag domain-containing protein n=1 Tax=Handroanthus impetiginosus TaxID=429701 RepID=A0A2G9I7F8_9LAMI|nr:hypothetical protein CDL12_01572 [Handroanthus impetiginosus]